MRNVRWTNVWVVCVLCLGVSHGIVRAGDEIDRPLSAQEIASAFLSAMESRDLDAAESLFAVDSSIFESGKVEGSWRKYREHHLGPELAEFSLFTFDRGTPRSLVSQDGTVAYVAWPLEYRIVRKDGRTSESLGTVTFVMVREGDDLKIQHFHWSRRRKATD